LPAAEGSISDPKKELFLGLNQQVPAQSIRVGRQVEF